MIAVEICLETVQSLRAAQDAGADRVELCASLDVGGLTPSPGMMRLAAELGVPARVLLRPRGGTFTYDADEIAVIERDIAAVRGFGLDGVVIGAAHPDGRLDRDLLARLVDQCGGLGRTLHRVFDLTPDPFEALELAIELGFDRVLTSGQQPTAAEGAPLLARLVASAAARITVLAACGIDADNVGELIRATAVSEVHSTCTDGLVAGPASTGDRFGFGYPPISAAPLAVRRLVENAKAAGGITRT
jgi:copper homeostasis protein